MNIEIVNGTGEGKTLKSAFDSALYRARISDYNIILLSSIIPKGSKVQVIKKHIFLEKNYGNRLYVVMAMMSQADIGKRASAGIGWIQQDDGKGMFIEHTAENESDVVEQIKISLSEMTARRKDIYDIKNIKYLTSSIMCREFPVCALVAAIYNIEGWCCKC